MSEQQRTREQMAEQVTSDIEGMVNGFLQSGQIGVEGWEGPPLDIEVGLVVVIRWPDDDELEAGDQ